MRAVDSRGIFKIFNCSPGVSWIDTRPHAPQQKQDGSKAGSHVKDNHSDDM
ncbi:hypothetical protein KIN20_008263 [Parelaphostrongylus tenuis]|uniref:Uncharacterized protein n=1 Tax=Parelaphostrongylus tenuis TaxID=148309 RepID=A0AAD5M7Q7_PARTN|nr:hypothetical protein KIN20_008263 [Parelaphostrongylus tenuis]